MVMFCRTTVKRSVPLFSLLIRDLKETLRAVWSSLVFANRSSYIGSLRVRRLSFPDPEAVKNDIPPRGERHVPPV